MLILTGRCEHRGSWAQRITLILALLACTFSLFPLTLHAQQGQTSIGTDFWVGFMPNSFYLGCCPPQGCTLFIGSGTNNVVDVDVYGGSQIPNEHHHQVMAANTVWTLPAPNEANWETPNPCEVANYRAIHVHSVNPVVVYGYQYTGANTSSTDSYLAIPTPALGTEYYPSCYYDDHYTLGPANPLAGQFLLISPYDNNVITIGPVKSSTRSDAGGSIILHSKGDTWSITLMKGQTYLVQSTGLMYGDEDITGTHIVSSLPLALISGHQLCSIPIGELADQNGSKDEIMEMIPPLSEWGYEYYDMPTATRNVCGDLVRVIAGEDGESITATSVNGQRNAILDKAGDFYDFDEVTDPTVFASKGNKKFLAVQMAYSQGFDGDPGQSDPFSIVLTPRQQFQKKLIFRIPDRGSSSGFVHFATFLCQDDSIRKIQLNGVPITSYQYAGSLPIPGTTPPMSAYRIQFPPKSNTFVATCGAKFGCYLYGWNQFESYGHPAGMALGVISPDTLPPLQSLDSQCGSFHVKLMELRHMPQFSFEDTRIADLAMITDTNDSRWPKPSYNYNFQIDPAHPFTPGDSVAYFILTVIDGSRDAYAAVWTTDRAGNDTVYEYAYHAPSLVTVPKSPFLYQPVIVSTDSCQTITLKNNTAKSITIGTAQVMGSAVGGKFTVTPTAINRTLQSGDTVQLRVCFTSLDTVQAFDTLALQVGCLPFLYPMVGLGVTPQIYASDLDFGNVLVGDTACKQLTIKNVGNAPLVIDKNWLLHNSKEFSFEDTSALPITIAPGKSTSLFLCFHPDTTGTSTGRQDWGTNLLTPFQHSIKDTSFLTGVGVQAGLNWDRSKQEYTAQCDSEVIRMYLLNTSSPQTGSSIIIQNISITGADANEFSILRTQVPSTTLYQLDPGASIWVDVMFKPDLTKGYALRSAQIAASGKDLAHPEHDFNPVISFSGIVRHSNIRITPAAYDFGTVPPNDALTTTVWIHNDGDTALTLNNVALTGTPSGIFTDSGFTPGQIIPPGDSIPIVINGNSQVGTMQASLTVGGDCDTAKMATFTAFSSRFAAVPQGADYGNVYVCQDSTMIVSISNNDNSKNAFVDSVYIIDTLGTTGASQFTFTDGKQSKGKLNLAINPGQTIPFTVKYTPSINGGNGAKIVFHLIIPENDPPDSNYVATLKGVGLHFANTVSARKNDVDTNYSVLPNNTISVPITLAQAFDPKAKVYGITYTLRYRRDMFVPEQVVTSGGLSGSTTQPVPVLDKTDPNYDLLTVTETSGSPIQGITTIANVVFLYVVNKDSTTPIQVQDLAFMNDKGNTVCWVSKDSIPGTFVGQNECGDLTLRRSLEGLPPVWVKSVVPNPASGPATVQYSLRENSKDISMELYDMLGNKVMTIASGAMASGDHTVNFDATELASGTYVLRLASGAYINSKRIVVQK